MDAGVPVRAPAGLNMRDHTDSRGGFRGKRFLVVAAAAVLIGMAGWTLRTLWIRGSFLPDWVEWTEKEIPDAGGEYELRTGGRKAVLFREGEAIWTSPPEVKIQDGLFADVNGDGADEMILLGWRIGRFGRDMPFWVEKNDKKWRQHIYVYQCGRDGADKKWVSSEIGAEVLRLSSRKRPEPERGSYLLLTETPGTVSCWYWDSWGFTKKDTEVTFAVFGDNLIHEPIYRYAEARGGNYDFLYEKLVPVIEAADVAVINQETPFTDGDDYRGYPRFATPLGVGEAIANAGFDVVTCATNHMMDLGTDGINLTKRFFDGKGIACIGIRSEEETEYVPYWILERKGIRFALLNYTYGTNGIPVPEDRARMLCLLGAEETVLADIRRASDEADLVLVFVHWGTEYAEQPDDFQREWAERFLAYGADVVIGSHPHVLQPCETLRDGEGHETLVYYSLGNYVSAQRERSCVKGGMAYFTVSLAQDGFRVTENGLRPLAITREEDGRYTVDFAEEERNDGKD